MRVCPGEGPWRNASGREEGSFLVPRVIVKDVLPRFPVFGIGRAMPANYQNQKP